MNASVELARARIAKRRARFLGLEYPPSINRGFQVKSLDSLSKLHPAIPGAMPGVKRFLGGILRGNDLDVKTRFCHQLQDLSPSEDPDCRYSGVVLVDEILEESGVYDNIPNLRIFEEEQRSMIGNTSKLLPYVSVGGLHEGVKGYFTNTLGNELRFNKKILRKAFRQVVKLIPERSLYRDSLEEVTERADKTTNWGLPFQRHGKDLDEEGNPYYLQYLALAKSDLANGTLTNLPCIITYRVTPNGKNEPKQRVAWQVPHHVVLLESMFQAPALRATRLLDEFAENLGQTASDTVITRMFRKSRQYNNPMIGFDASGYDKSIPRVLIDMAYEVLKCWFQEVDAGLLDLLCQYMATCDLVTPVGVYGARNGAVASGMAATNLIDSIVQLILYHYVRLKLNVPFDECCACIVHGDDGGWLIPGLTLVILSYILLHDFKMVSNPKKCTFSTDYLSFCMRTYFHEFTNSEGVNIGIRSLYRTYQSITSNERRPPEWWNEMHDVTRCVAQLIVVENHPCHKELTNLMVMADTSFGLGRKLKGGVLEVFKKAGGTEKVIKAIGASSWDRERLTDILSPSKLGMTKTAKLIDRRR